MPQVRREKRVQVPVQFEDGLVITLAIDKNRATSAWGTALAEAEGDIEAANCLAEIIVGWDVEGDDGTPMPVTGVAIFENFDQEDLVRLVEEMNGALQPPRAEKNASSQPSNEKPSIPASEPPLTSPNGSETSESQSVSASPSTR